MLPTVIAITGSATSSITSTVRPGRRRTSRRASRAASRHDVPRRSGGAPSIGLTGPPIDASSGAVSSTIRPSRRNTTRSAHDARCGSWVTRMTAVPSRLGQLGDQLDDLVAVHRVERAGRLVGQQQVPGPDDRPGDRDALLLPAGEVVGVPVDPGVEPDPLERLDRARPRLADAHPVELQRQHHVLDRGERGDEVEALEDVADVPAPQVRAAAGVERRQVLPVDEHPARARLLERPGQVQQRGLPAAGRPHHRDELTGRDRQRDARHRAHLGGAATEALHDVDELEHGLNLFGHVVSFRSASMRDSQRSSQRRSASARTIERVGDERGRERVVRVAAAARLAALLQQARGRRCAGG